MRALLAAAAVAIVAIFVYLAWDRAWQDPDDAPAVSADGDAPGGAMGEVRMTSEDLSPNLEYTESSAIRSDGQITEMIRTDAQGGGTINGELCYDTNVSDEVARGPMASAAWNLITPGSGPPIRAEAPTPPTH